MTQEQKSEIINFINRRFKDNCKWANGNCYWFAHILCTRFPFLEIYHCPIEGHFVAGYNGVYFDWLGEVTNDRSDILRKVERLKDIEQIDDLHYSHLMRDCRD